MQKILDFLKESGTFYLATVEGDQPRVRPFGAVEIFEGRLYILTGKAKKVSKQISANPKVELCAVIGGRVLRIQALAVEDDRREAKQHMLDTNPYLQGQYAADDENMQVLCLKDALATITCATGEPVVSRF